MIDDDKVRFQNRRKMRNRPVQPQLVKTSFLGVRKQAFHVFQGAGHLRLAMPLQHRHVDQKVDFIHRIHDMQFHTGRIDRVRFLFLPVNERDMVMFGKLAVAAVFESVRCFVADPGAFDDPDIRIAVLPQILDDAGDDLRVRGSSK